MCADTVLAEIVHLPRPGLGNIASRPVLRTYEIPYAGTSGTDIDQQLRVEDLFVGVEREKRFFLWSARLQRRVIPVMSSAHNFALENCLSVYRFLCYLSTHGHRRIDLPSVDSAAFPRVPRIRFGRCILRAACWNLDEMEFASLKTMFRADGNIDRWATERGIPRLTTYGVGDQTLVLDLRNPVLIACFLDARHAFSLSLREASPDQRQSAVVDERGQRYRHEIVLPMLRSADLPRQGALSAVKRVNDGDIAHLPGGEWLSLKVYAGTRTIERLLTELLPPIVARHSDCCGRAPWFFVRYADPTPHLRLRFSGPRESLLGKILPAMHDALAPLRSSGLIARVQVDTYVPELTRYGGKRAMSAVEDIFCADSIMHLDVVRSSVLSNSQSRLVFVVHSIDNIPIRDFGLAEDAHRRLLVRLSASMIDEFGASSRLKKQIGEHYRELRAAFDDEISSEAMNLISARSRRQTPTIETLRQLQVCAELTADIPSIVASLAHMSLNRLFVSHPRQQEMLVYEFARRLSVTESLARKS